MTVILRLLFLSFFHPDRAAVEKHSGDVLVGEEMIFFLSRFLNETLIVSCRCDTKLLIPWIGSL